MLCQRSLPDSRLYAHRALEELCGNGTFGRYLTFCLSSLSYGGCNSIGRLHSMKKKYLQVTFRCFSFSQLGNLCQCLEGPISTLKDYNRNIGVQKETVIPIMLPTEPSGTLTPVPYLRQAGAPKKVLERTFCL